jgi:hypothetical protein
MSIRVETARGPAFLASALINGDVSSFDDAGNDQRALEAFTDFHAPGRIVSTVDDSEPYFATICYAGGLWFTGDVVEYVIHYDE